MAEALASDIQRWLASQHIRVTQEWLEACLEFLREEFEVPAWNSWDVGRWRREVRQQWLFADLRELETGGLSEEVCTQPKAILRATACVQLLFAVDVSQPLYAQLRKEEGSTNENALVGAETEENNGQGPEPTSQRGRAPSTARTLLLHLTDGVREIRGLEQQPCPALTPENLHPGAKFLLRGPIVARRGVLLLGPDHLRPLGGQVDGLMEEHRPLGVLRAALKKATGVDREPRAMQNPREEPRAMQNPREDSRAMQNPREDPRGVQNPREDPRAMQIPRENPRAIQIPREDPRAMLFPREDPRAMQNSRERPRLIKEELKEETPSEWDQDIDLGDDWEPLPPAQIKRESERKVEPQLKREGEPFGSRSPPRKKDRTELLYEIFGKTSPRPQAPVATDFDLDDDLDWMEAAAAAEAAAETDEAEPIDFRAPFSYIAEVYSDVQSAADLYVRRCYIVKGFLLTLLGRLEFHNGEKWSLDVRLTDGSANVDCEMSNDLLTSDLLVGHSAADCARLRELARTGSEAAKAELVDSLKEVQARLARLNGLFQIEVDGDWPKPRIVGYREVGGDDVRALERRLGQLRAERC